MEQIPPRLTKETLKELWSKTYNDQGKPDWSHIFPYYHPQIIFQDSIQRVDGFELFEAMCHRLTKRCQKLTMDILRVEGEGNTLFFEWKMTMVFRRTPNTPIFGASRLTLNEDGQIIEQRDYYDLWGDIYNGIPGFRRLYRWFMKKVFG